MHLVVEKIRELASRIGRTPLQPRRKWVLKRTIRGVFTRRAAIFRLEFGGRPVVVLPHHDFRHNQAAHSQALRLNADTPRSRIAALLTEPSNFYAARSAGARDGPLPFS